MNTTIWNQQYPKVITAITFEHTETLTVNVYDFSYATITGKIPTFN